MRKVTKSLIYFVFGCCFGIILEYTFNRRSADNIRKEELVGKDYVIKGFAIYNNVSGLYIENTKAERLSRTVPILCWVLTHTDHLYTKAKAVKETWGRRCNIILFFSSEEDESFPAIRLSGGKNNQWHDVQAAWKYVFDHHLNDANWFFKAHDDTFLIVENLRHFLSNFWNKDPHFFGYNLWFEGVEYNSGGSGYVLSKDALKRFIANQNDCKPKSEDADIAVGYCLNKIGIHPEDSKDVNGKEVFHPFAPDFRLIPNAVEKSNWLFKRSKWEVVTGPHCCSEWSIAFHGMTSKRMYVFNHYLYNLQKHIL